MKVSIPTTPTTTTSWTDEQELHLWITFIGMTTAAFGLGGATAGIGSAKRGQNRNGLSVESLSVKETT